MNRDCINRQDAIDVAIQAADDWDGGYNPERAEMIERGLKMLPALQAESCEDCINRKEVNVLVDELARAISDERCFMSRGRSTTDIMQDILDLPSVTPKAGWIPVSERLPKDRELMLFSTKTDRVFEGRYFDDNTDRQWYSFRDDTFAWNNVVTAWMPLPEAYTESEEEIRVMPFDWNDNLSEIAQEDFSLIQENLSYGTATTIGMALAKLELLEKQGCKVTGAKLSQSRK